MRELINIHHFKRYKKFIQSRTPEANRLSYVENHHIIPKSIIKNDGTISLTAREHFIAHKMLTKVFKKNTKPWHSMAKAFHRMFCVSDAHSKTLTYIKSRDYEYSKKLHSEAMRFKNPMHDPEVVTRAVSNRRKSWTPERRAANAERARGRTLPPAAKEKLSALWAGVPKPRKPGQDAKITKASAMGLFITPWGEFDSPGQASREEGNAAGLSRYLINKFCKDPNIPEYSFISNGKEEVRGKWKRNK